VAVSLSSVPRVLAHVAAARDVAFGAYFLPPRSAAAGALLDAAHRGAHVALTLQSDPYRNPYGARGNAAVARELRAAGGEVRLLPSDEAPFHLKAAVCDGVAYLDDRNWTKRGPEIVLADDDPHDVALVREALAGRSGGAARESGLATRKDDALRRELELVESAGARPVVVETERVATSPLTRALEGRALAGEPTTLIVGRAAHRSRTEAHAIAELKRDGVDVRSGGANEKLALAGDTAWIGSGNATGVSGRNAGQLEWGMLTRDPAIVGAVRTSLERDAA
jgi:mRNA-degrading endonuclease toxin of MazEF toxin-antitoxin module